MADNYYPQNNKNSEKPQKEINRPEFLRKTYEDVWQDRRASERAHTASDQPSRINKSMRAHLSNKNSGRSQKHIPSRNTEQAVGWVLKPRSILINEYARQWGITRSKAVARFIDLGIENMIISANANLLVQALREAVAIECRRFFGRLTAILFRIYIMLAQVLHLQRHQVARSGFQKKLTPGQVEKIIAWSKQQAKSDVALKNGNVDEDLDKAISAWLEQFDGKVETEEKKGEGN